MPDYLIIMLLESKDKHEKCQKIDELLLTSVLALKILNNIATFVFQFSINISTILMIYCWSIVGI